MWCTAICEHLRWIPWSWNFMDRRNCVHQKSPFIFIHMITIYIKGLRPLPPTPGRVAWIYSRRHTSMQRMHSLCLRLPSCSSHESTPGPLAPTRNPPPSRSNPRGRSQGNSGNTRSKTNFHASRSSQNGHCPLIEPAACCRAWHGYATTVHIHLLTLRQICAKQSGNRTNRSPPRWWLRPQILRCKWLACRSHAYAHVSDMQRGGAFNKSFRPNSSNSSHSQRKAVFHQPLARA